MTISARMNEALRKSALSKAEVAERMDVSRAYITQLLSGRANPSWNKLREFFAVLGYEADISLRKKPSGTRSSIPDKFSTMFWDAELEKLDPLKHRNYIFRRILNSENQDAWNWLRRRFSLKQIIYFIDKNHDKLDPKSLNFWAVILNKEDKWLNIAEKTRSNAWRKLKNIPS